MLSKDSIRVGTGGDFFNGSASSNDDGGTAAAAAAAGAAFGDIGDVGGNLNSLFIDPFLLFLFSAFMSFTFCGVVGLAAARSRRTVCVLGSSSASSGVGSNWRGLNSLAEEGWLTKLEAGGVPGAVAREGGGIEER